MTCRREAIPAAQTSTPKIPATRHMCRDFNTDRCHGTEDPEIGRKAPKIAGCLGARSGRTLL